MSDQAKACCDSSCCDQPDEVSVAVRQRYGATANSSLNNESAGVRAVAQAFGYSEAELASIPVDANMGLSCGNPTAMASLRPGETVVDLGCGGGLDVFLAAQKVGPTGKAIGIDMTSEMIERARRAADRGTGGKPYDNVEFHLSTIDKLPLPDGSVDVIISNCVINLATDKLAVFREMYRVLKPGGRVAVSDIALKQSLPSELANDLLAYIGCIAGAIPVPHYETGLSEAGFGDVAIVDAQADLNAYAQIDGQAGCCSPAAFEPKADSMSLPIADQGGCCGSSSGHANRPGMHEDLLDVISRYDLNEYAASVKVFAVKPVSR